MARPSRFSAAEQQVIIARYQKGESCGILARDYGCSPSTISTTLTSHGIEIVVSKQSLNPLDRILTEDQKLKIAIAYNRGASSESLRLEYSLTQAQLTRYLHQAGATVRPRGRQSGRD